jgi:hypothetical protein
MIGCLVLERSAAWQQYLGDPGPAPPETTCSKGCVKAQHRRILLSDPDVNSQSLAHSRLAHIGHQEVFSQMGSVGAAHLVVNAASA